MASEILSICSATGSSPSGKLANTLILSVIEAKLVDKDSTNVEIPEAAKLIAIPNIIIAAANPNVAGKAPAKLMAAMREPAAKRAKDPAKAVIPRATIINCSGCKVPSAKTNWARPIAAKAIPPPNISPAAPSARIGPTPAAAAAAKIDVPAAAPVEAGRTPAKDGTRNVKADVNKPTTKAIP